jgi:hypothetical protein
VVGAGPAGIVSALEAARRGVDVVLIETGNLKPQPHSQRLSAADIKNPKLHASVEMTVSRQVGGTSAIWGGRCVPYDPVDFLARRVTGESAWPLGYDELQGYFRRACDWFKCGPPNFDVSALSHLPRNMIPGLSDGNVRTSSLERWSLPTDFGKAYFGELRDKVNLTLILMQHACVSTWTEIERALQTWSVKRWRATRSQLRRTNSLLQQAGWRAPDC